MSAEVISLAGKSPVEKGRQEVNTAVVARLKELLAQAERGEITSFVGAWSNLDGSVTTALELNEHRFAIGHALGALTWRFHERMNDEAY